MKLVISKHARQRFVTRFGNRFHKSYFYDVSLTESLIQQLYAKSVETVWDMGSPFYRNKIESAYGPTVVRMTVDRSLYFILTPLPHAYILRTVVPQFSPRTFKGI